MTAHMLVATWSQVRRKAAKWCYGPDAEALSPEALSQRMERKQRLVKHGAGFAEQSLRDIEARVSLGLRSLRSEIERDLATQLNGSETEADVQELVNAILDDHLGGLDA